MGSLTTSVSQATTVIGARQFVDHLATRQQMVNRFEPRSHADDAPSGVVHADVVSSTPRRVAAPAGDSSPTTVESATWTLPPVAVRRLANRAVPAESHGVGDAAAEMIHADPAAHGGAPGSDLAPSQVEPSSPSGATSQPHEIFELGAQPLPERQASRRPRRLGLGAPQDMTPSSSSSSNSNDGGSSDEAVPQDIRDAIQRAHAADLGDAVIDRSSDAAVEARRLEATAFTRDGIIHLPESAGHIDSAEVRGLIAHELTHVAQQRRLGAALPREDSDEGRLLEAQARIAHQFFRGDAGAPLPGSLDRIDAQSMLTTGVAIVDDKGRISYSPASAEMVQRDALSTTTPNYAWQRQWAIDHGFSNEVMTAAAGGWYSDQAAATPQDNAGIEDRHLWDLIDIRNQERHRLLNAADEADQRRDFAAAPPAHPAIQGLTAADDVAAAAAIHRAQDAVHAEAQQATADAALVRARNSARDQVDTNFPIRNWQADDNMRHEPDPDPLPTPSPANTALAAVLTQYSDLIIRFPELSGSAAAARSGGTPAAHAGGPTGAPSSAGPTGTPTVHPTGSRPGQGAGPAAGGGAPPSGATSPGGGPHSAMSGGSSSTPDYSWQAAAGTAADVRADRMTDWYSSDANMTAEQIADRARERGEAHESDHLPALRHARAAYMTEMVNAKIDQIKRSEQQAGRPIPSNDQALDLITSTEWGEIIQSVETARPVHTLSDANSLIGDPANAHYFAKVGVAQPERATEKAARELRERQTRERNEAAARAAGGQAGQAGQAGHPQPAGAHTGQAPAHAGQGHTDAAHPAAHAVASAVAHGGIAAAVGLAAGAVAGHEAAHADAAHAQTQLGHQAGDLHLTPELLRRLSAELYVRMRSTLRSELIVDRERSGVLTDFR